MYYAFAFVFLLFVAFILKTFAKCSNYLDFCYIICCLLYDVYALKQIKKIVKMLWQVY